MLIVGAFAVLIACLFYGGVWVVLLLMLLKLERIRRCEELTTLGVIAIYCMRFTVLAMLFLPPMEMLMMTVSRTSPWPPDDWDTARLKAHALNEFLAAVGVAMGLAALICVALYVFGRRRIARTA